MRNSARRLLLAALMLVSGPAAGLAQAPLAPSWTSRSPPTPPGPSPTIPPAPIHEPARIGPLAVGATLGVVALASLADQPLRDLVQDHRSPGGDDFARTMRRLGQPEVYVTVGLGVLGSGLVLGNPRVTRSGGRITAGLLTAGVASSLLKVLVGRRRPGAERGAHSFAPLTGADGFPSGHTTMAFALATSVGDEIGSTPVRVLLFGGATLTAWSRLNDDRHWGSDVLAGAAVGIASARLMNGRWKILGLSAPRFLLEPGTAGLSFTF